MISTFSFIKSPFRIPKWAHVSSIVSRYSTAFYCVLFLNSWIPANVQISQFINQLGANCQILLTNEFWKSISTNIIIQIWTVNLLQISLPVILVILLMMHYFILINPIHLYCSSSELWCEIQALSNLSGSPAGPSQGAGSLWFSKSRAMTANNACTLSLPFHLPCQDAKLSGSSLKKNFDEEHTYN